MKALLSGVAERMLFKLLQELLKLLLRLVSDSEVVDVSDDNQSIAIEEARIGL